jgi:hypothetical protein
MKNTNFSALCFTICATLLFPSISCADTVLEYLVREGRGSKATTQSVAIKNDRIMVKAAGGDKNLDLLYLRSPEGVVVVDHIKRTLMTVDEPQVYSISRQVQNVQPLLQVLGEQISDLSPEQRQKWQELLGENVPLDELAKAAEPQEPARLVPAGVSKIADISCRKFRIMQGATPMAEVYLADAAAMKISDNDASTIRALLSFYERLAAKNQGLACQLGLTLPNISASEVKGIPIGFLELSRKSNGSATLRRIDISTVSPELMRIPKGYKAVPLTLWP